MDVYIVLAIDTDIDVVFDFKKSFLPMFSWISKFTGTNASAETAVAKRTQVELVDTQQCSAGDCQSCHGTVTPHDFHVLVRLPKRENSGNGLDGIWWPEKVDGDKVMQEIQAALPVKAKIKLTACAFSVADEEDFFYEAFVFPGNIHVKAENGRELGILVHRIVSSPDDAERNMSTSIIHDMIFVVCCHANRDARCGKHGPEIAQELRSRGYQHVVMSSHVGGHKYAGNVACHHPSHPVNGSWFGGVQAHNVDELLQGIRQCENENKSPVQVKVLRKFWRGKIGWSKEKQVEEFEMCKDIEDL